MKNKTEKRRIIWMALLATILFSIFIKIDSVFQVANTLAERGWSLLAILSVSVLIRMISAGVVVLALLPPILGYKNIREGLPGFLKIGRQIVLLGMLSL